MKCWTCHNSTAVLFWSAAYMYILRIWHVKISWNFLWKSPSIWQWHSKRNSQSIFLGYRGLTQWTVFCRRHFQMHFLNGFFVLRHAPWTIMCVSKPQRITENIKNELHSTGLFQGVSSVVTAFLKWHYRNETVRSWIDKAPWSTSVYIGLNWLWCAVSQNLPQSRALSRHFHSPLAPS